MVPFTLSAQQFVSRYKRSLDQLSPEAITQLRELFSRTAQPTVESAMVELFLDADNYGAPTVWIYFSGAHNKVDNADQSIFAGRSIELSLGLEKMEEFDEQYFSDYEFGGLSTMANALKNWFAECWWKAGGWAYPVPTKVQVHDGYGDGHTLQLTERS